MGSSTRKDSLVIGKSSQLARYFPAKGHEFLSSRRLDIEYIKSKKWKKIYLCAAEQRTYDHTLDFEKYNVKNTIDIIDSIKDRCEKLIVYSTAELWNKVHGKIDLSMNHRFNTKSPYIASKKGMTDILLGDPIKYHNIVVLFPFNFNSVYRKGDFLFAKIFDSIVNKIEITIGDTYFYRELLHPSYVVQRSLLAAGHEIIGSGRVVFVNDFIRDLYRGFGLEYNRYVSEIISNHDKPQRDIYFLDSTKCLYSYDELLRDTLEDFSRKEKPKNDKISKRHNQQRRY